MSLMTCVSTKINSLSTTTATEIVAANALRAHLVVIPSASVYIGGSDVTSSNGAQVTGGTIFAIPATGCQAAMYAIAFSGSTTSVSAVEFNLL